MSIWNATKNYAEGESFNMGVFVVFVGPSGVGKTTIVEELLKRVPKSARLITTTTRLPRPNEKNDVDYYFLSKEKFRHWKEAYLPLNKWRF